MDGIWGAGSNFGNGFIALDATHVYAADNHGGTIWRVAKEGGNPEVLAPSALLACWRRACVFWRLSSKTGEHSHGGKR